MTRVVWHYGQTKAECPTCSPEVTDAPEATQLPDVPESVAEQAVPAVAGAFPDWARDPDTLERIFHAALQQGDIKGVGHALHLLLIADPTRGLKLHGELQEALVVAKFLGG